MGQPGSKYSNYYRYSIPLNTQLNDDLSNKLAIKKSPDEATRFKKVINKKLKKDFTPSYFIEKFTLNNSGISHISNLINLIYTKNTNTNLKMTSNRTLYEGVFNYDIIKKESKGYQQFSKTMISNIRMFIEGEEKEGDNTLILSEDIRNDIDYNKGNDDENLTEAFQDIKDEASHITKTNGNDMGTIKLTEDSFRDKDSFSKKESQNESIKLNLDNNKYSNNTIYINNKEKVSTSKKKHSKVPLHPPVVNIKIDLKDIIKQNIYLSSTLSPNQRFNKTKNHSNKSIKASSSVNTYSNIVPIKENVSQVNVDDGNFLDMVDCLVQPNKKKDLIHSRTPKRKVIAYKSPSSIKQSVYKSKVSSSNNLK